MGRQAEEFEDRLGNKSEGVLAHLHFPAIGNFST
jgi:hypothetical protein